MSTQQRRGLGRGLGALLGDAPVPTAPAAHAAPPVSAEHIEAIRNIPVDRIRPNRHQPRKTFDRSSLDDLAASIREHGVLVPILVRERGDTFELIAGERRWRACAQLQMKEMPAVVRAAGDRESLEVAIIENLQREDLNVLEEAAGIAELIESHAYTQEQVAKRLGKARPSIANALRLLMLPEEIKAMIADGRLSAGHAKVLLGAPPSMQVDLAQRAFTQGLSVRNLEKLVASLTQTPAAAPVAKERTVNADDADFESRLRERLAAGVALKRSARGGSIEIKFASEAELMRIADILLGE